jgi:hypothetical protein
MKILHLTLKRKWFDMIESGEKPEEYREIKPYWIKRLCDKHDGCIGGDFMDQHNCYAFTFKNFDMIVARNGYSKTSRVLKRKLLWISIDVGLPAWGAEPGKNYFVIKLGERIA